VPYHGGRKRGVLLRFADDSNRIGSLRTHFSQKTREMGHSVLQSSTDAMPLLHARSLAPLVKTRGLGMTPVGMKLRLSGAPGHSGFRDLGFHGRSSAGFFFPLLKAKKQVPRLRLLIRKRIGILPLRLGSGLGLRPRLLRDDKSGGWARAAAENPRPSEAWTGHPAYIPFSPIISLTSLLD
jgi:hypothetical protein